MGEANEHPEDERELPDASEEGPAPEAEQGGLLAALLDAQSDGEGPASQPPAPIGGPALRVGRLVAWAPGRGPMVDFPGNPRGPLRARTIVPLDPKIVDAAIAAGQGVVLQFEGGRPAAPIITGLLQPLEGVELGEDASEDASSEAADDASPAPAEVELEPGGNELEARIDGRRVELEAADEIVLRCGKASIVLRRNGRVVIRGTYVETRSRGVNRIKGGSVEIN